jgi:hypothetical protein
MLVLSKERRLQGEWNIIGINISPARGIELVLITKCSIQNDVITMILFGKTDWLIKAARDNDNDYLFTRPTPLTLASDSTVANWVGFRFLAKTKKSIYLKSLSTNSGPMFWIFTQVKN